MTHWMRFLNKCVEKSSAPSRKTAYSGLSMDTNVMTVAIALTRAGFPFSGAKRSLNVINIFSLIFFFILRFLLYFKWVSVSYTRI